MGTDHGVHVVMLVNCSKPEAACILTDINLQSSDKLLCQRIIGHSAVGSTCTGTSTSAVQYNDYLYHTVCTGTGRPYSTCTAGGRGL